MSPSPAATIHADAASVITMPGVIEVIGACGSLALLGICAGLGAGEVALAARAVPAGLLVAAGSVVLTGPALVVAHQYQGLQADPQQLVSALSRGFVTCGEIALGLSPILLFFSATSGLWAALYSLFVAGAGAFGGAVTARQLLRAEAAARPAGAELTDHADLTARAGMGGLVLAWSTLAALIALRIGWGMAAFVAGS